VSLAVSGLLYALFRSLQVSLLNLAGGTLIDLDHLYDYFRYPHRPAQGGFDPRHFFDVINHNRLERVFILLHGWELTAALLIAGWWMPAGGGWMIPLGFGMGVHILLDAFCNKASVSGYSLAARGAHRFDGNFFYGSGESRKGRQRPGSPN
jgi:hypothetical protein